MIKIVGKLFNSLQYHVDKNINETLYQNKTFLSSKWSFLEFNILNYSQNYKYSIFLSIILAISFVTNLLLWKEALIPLVNEYVPYWPKLIVWQSTFLAGQLTIVGVVYPLVIGLIGVLFQNKSAKKTLFPVYQVYSGFMFAGLSGLFLSIFIILGYFLSASITESSYLAICITSALWFIFNILLTCWFFTATFLMLDESKRDRLIVRFTIHELCEKDIRERIRELLLQNSVKNKLLINTDEDVLKVSTYKFSDDKYNEIIIQSEKSIYIHNVYFSIINLIIKYQIYKLRTINWFSNTWINRLVSKASFLRLNIDNELSSEIVIQPIWKKENKSLVICRYSGFTIGWLSKLLIKKSFTVKKNKNEADKSVTSMVLAFTGTAFDALREKNIGEFRYALDNIVKWHIEIASALSFLNDNQEEDNWLLLSSPNFFTKRNYLDEILSEYYQIAKASVELIPENIEFFDEIIYLHRLLFSSRDKLVKRESLSLIQGSYLTWSLLMEWRSYSSSSSDIRISNKYEDVLFDFVGAWESWLDVIEARSNLTNNLSTSLPLFIEHLEFTAHTVISGLRYNNIEAAGWGVDMLNNWIEKLLIGEQYEEYAVYMWKSELVTHNLLLKEIDDPLWIAILNSNDFDLSSAFDISLTNAVFDLRVITACYILLKPNVNENKKIKQYILALLSGEAIHSTGSIGGALNCINDASGIVGAYIRHSDYRKNGYGSWLSKVLQSFGRVNEKRKVSGRIYSGWGRTDPNSMGEAYIEIAVSFSNIKWKLERRWFDIIFSENFRHKDRQSLVRDFEEWIKLSSKIKKPTLITKEEFDKNLTNFEFSIKEVIAKINKHTVETVSNAKVNEEILTRFGLVCSEIFTDVGLKSSFPINLFNSINFNLTSEKENLYSLNFEGYKKEEIALGVDVNRALNEEDWLKESTKNNLITNVLRKLISYKITDSKCYSYVEDNILDFKKLAESIVNPILFVGNKELARILFKSKYDHELAAKLGISFIDGYGKNYICHIQNIPVYRINFSDINYNLLISKSLFDSVEFGEITETQFVEAEYKESDRGVNIGVLSLSYLMKITLITGLPCIKTEVKIKGDNIPIA